MPPTSAPSEDDVFARTSLAELNRQQPLADAFFEYDQADLSERDRTALQRDANWLRRWNHTRVAIEGHADERGTSEYNLALGERRAVAVRAYLASLGVDVARLTIVSMGKEEPFCREHTEGCWTENRRGHFVITAK